MLNPANTCTGSAGAEDADPANLVDRDMSATPFDLRARAEALFAQARRLIDQADDLETAARDRADARRRKMAIRTICGLAWAGYGDGAIVCRLASELGCAPAAAALILQQELSRSARLRAAHRNRLIVQLAFAGRTNAAIAARADIGLSEKHVSRIVSAALRTGYGLAPDLHRSGVLPARGRFPLTRSAYSPGP